MSCRDYRYPVNDRVHDPVPEKVAVAARVKNGDSNHRTRAEPAVALRRTMGAARFNVQHKYLSQLLRQVFLLAG